MEKTEKQEERKYIDYDALMAWVDNARSNTSPCEDARDMGYLDCLDDLKEIAEELLETSNEVIRGWKSALLVALGVITNIT